MHTICQYMHDSVLLSLFSRAIVFKTFYFCHFLLKNIDIWPSNSTEINKDLKFNIHCSTCSVALCLSASLKISIASKSTMRMKNNRVHLQRLPKLFMLFTFMSVMVVNHLACRFFIFTLIEIFQISYNLISRNSLVCLCVCLCACMQQARLQAYYCDETFTDR